MADTYSPSNLNTLQVVLAQQYQKAELRRKERPVLQMATGNAPFTLPDYEKLKTAESRTVEVKYLKQSAAGAATTKVAQHTAGAKGASGTMNLSFPCIVENFYASVKMGQNNVFSYDRMFGHQMAQAWANAKDRAETAGLSYAAAHNAQIALTAKGGGSWNGATYALELSDPNLFINQAKNFMRGRYYSGEYDIIPDLNLWSKLEPSMWQGAGNSTNLNPQFSNCNFFPTSETISGNYGGGAALIMPSKTFVALPWNDPKNVEGVNAGMNEVGVLDTMLDPEDGKLVADISMRWARADESANGGGVQDINVYVELTLWLGWGLPPLSTVNDSPLHLLGLVG